MQIRDIMSRSVELIDPNAMIRDAAIRMRDQDLGALPVGENDRLIGVVTDRDIAVRAVANDQGAGTTAVREVMSEGVVYCFDDDDVEQARRLMAEHQLRRMPVVSREKRLVGMVALADLARGGAEGAAQEALSEVTQPTEHQSRR